MKISKVIKLCKKQGCIHLYDNSANQWLSDGYGLYPLYGSSKFTPESLATMYDISKKQQDKMNLKSSIFLPSELNYEEFDNSEGILESYGFSFIHNGTTIIPYHTAEKVIFIDTEYLQPFSDMNNIKLYLRFAAQKKSYIVVKQGFLIYGVLSPINILDCNFYNLISKFAADCKSAYDKNKELASDDG